MSKPSTIHPFARIPPPLLFAASFLVGVLVQRAAWPEAPPALQPWARALAALIGLAGLLLALSAVLLFARNRTTIVPHGQPAALIIQGPYRLTRNPMYVSLTLLYAGLAIWTRSWFAFILCLFPLGVINWLVIPMEEARLLARFGDAYVAYQARVRRWL